jgi:hypothetical protein
VANHDGKEDLAEANAEARGWRGMLSFTNLPEEQRWQIIAFFELLLGSPVLSSWRR